MCCGISANVFFHAKDFKKCWYVIGSGTPFQQRSPFFHTRNAFMNLFAKDVHCRNRGVRCHAFQYGKIWSWVFKLMKTDGLFPDNKPNA